jgi:hypothetical protein
MNSPSRESPTFWQTVWLLLATARKRSDGRRTRARQLLQNRSDGKGTDWGGLGFAFFVVFMIVINLVGAVMVNIVVECAQRVNVERQGKIVVSSSFFTYVSELNSGSDSTQQYADEAKRISEKYGGSKTAIEQRLRSAVSNDGTADLIKHDAAMPGLKHLDPTQRFPAMLGSLALFGWLLMLVCQGEGADVDVQRRRHPMWEWLFSHPVQPGAVFLAEMLAPIAANPMYWAAPIFAGVVYGLAYDPLAGMVAAGLIGVPIAIAAACLGKALEIGILLRFSPSSRGAMIGLMGWLGYTMMMVPLIGIYAFPMIISQAAKILLIFARVPWPWLHLFLGVGPHGSLSFANGVLTCATVSGLVIAISVSVSIWGTQKGLSGSFAMDRPKRSMQHRRNAGFGKEPLYRKELLWFTRDRSAIVQTLLVPISVAGLQVFNLRGILMHAQGAWNYLCGVAILFGTYFLWILGPKSLQSEGTALWISLTWPRGLENLLKAKAWLWSMISSGLVGIVLLYTAIVFKSEIWKVALVGLGWFLFSRSMAEKSVTLVTVTPSSGEPEKVPTGRRWAAQLGMFTFAIGVVTQQWQLAIIGIVYSFVTAAAMWQNFRARLPYLYDPWSEKLPPAPTLMHAMISISILIEASAFLSVPLFLVIGQENRGIALALGYGVSAIVVSLFVSNFLRGRDVLPQDIWCWLPAGHSVEECESWARRYGIGDKTAVSAMLMGASGGMALGLFARGYLAVLSHIPTTAELIRKGQEQMASIPGLHFWYAIMAIVFAPFAEEYLFRGLLFRALDREWGGWRAIVASAAFFAIYHPPMSWIPVGLLGAANCLIFKKTGKLAPAVLLHMMYNAVVLT